MKNKTCMICKTAVLIPGDEHVVVKHNNPKDEILSKGYYHIKCFRDRLNGSSNANKLQKEALSFIRGAKKKIGIEDDEVITI